MTKRQCWSPLEPKFEATCQQIYTEWSNTNHLTTILRWQRRRGRRCGASRWGCGTRTPARTHQSRSPLASSRSWGMSQGSIIFTIIICKIIFAIGICTRCQSELLSRFCKLSLEYLSFYPVPCCQGKLSENCLPNLIVQLILSPSM